MEKKKFAVLYPHRDNATVYFRLTVPMRHFTELEPVVYKVPKEKAILVAEFVKNIKEDVLVLHRVSDNTVSIAQYAYSVGKKVVFDTDDLEYGLPSNHHLKVFYEKHAVMDYLSKIMRCSESVWVTTKSLKNNLAKLTTADIKVIPNAIDPFEKQWNTPWQNSREVPTIGWVGGVSHLPDLPECVKGLKQLVKEKVPFHFKVCGMPPLDQQFEMMKVKGVDKKIPLPQERQYQTLIKKLFHFIPDDQISLVDAKSLLDYGTFYDDIDIVIAPLADNSFNNCKSELKILEAGMKKLPIIVSRVNTYLDFDYKYKDTIAFASSPGSWYNKLKPLLDSKELRNQKGEILYQSVKEGYSIFKYAKERENILKGLIN